jgi:hypothetical protein
LKLVTLPNQHVDLRPASHELSIFGKTISVERPVSLDYVIRPGRCRVIACSQGHEQRGRQTGMARGHECVLNATLARQQALDFFLVLESTLKAGF